VVSCVQGSEVILPELATSHLFRILQEAVSNALKYAMASTITVQLQANDSKAHFAVIDDGCGFNTNVIKGNGLKNMQYRISELNGSLQVVSIHEKGTTITGSFPI
jgi:signal transduction histidine kinase